MKYRLTVVFILIIALLGNFPSSVSAQVTVLQCNQESTFILRPGETIQISIPASSALRIGQENTGGVSGPNGPIALQPNRSTFLNESSGPSVETFTNVSTTQFIAIYACTFQLLATATPTRTPTITSTPTTIPSPTQPPAFNACFTAPMRTGMKYSTTTATTFGGVDFSGAPAGTPVSGASRGGTIWDSIAGWPAGLSGMEGWWVRNIGAASGGFIIKNQEIPFSGPFKRIPTNEPIGMVWGLNVTAFNGQTMAELCPPNYLSPSNVVYSAPPVCFQVESKLALYAANTLFDTPTQFEAVVWDEPNSVYQIPGFTSNGEIWLEGNYQNWTFQRLSGGTVRIANDLTTILTIDKIAANIPYTIPSATTRLLINANDVDPFTGLLCTGTAPTPTATVTTTATNAPLPTGTATPTTYPTPDNNCQLVLVPNSGSITQQQPAGYVYAQNGIVRIESTVTGQTVFADQTPQLYAGDEVLLSRVAIFNPAETSVRVIFCTGLPTPTPSPTPTIPGLPCPIADSIAVPVAPGTVELTLTVGLRFVVTGAPVFVNVGDTAREIRPGNYDWQLEPGTFDAYSLTVVATVYICLEAAPTQTPTFEPTYTPGPLPIGDEPPPCVPFITPTPGIEYTMPDLVISIPTMRPAGTITATITATVTISTTAIAALFGTVEAGLIEPVEAISTVTAAYTWETGQEVAATSVAVAEPAFAWISIVNPNSPAWQTVGGPLWALAPLIGPILPIFAFFLIAALIRFVLWLIDWLLKLIDLVIKLIELIPGM